MTLVEKIARRLAEQNHRVAGADVDLRNAKEIADIAIAHHAAISRYQKCGQCAEAFEDDA
ncbi:hypothetical protein LCGC14_0319900 [marine sediment metagenome]|uniref:Uncharacterized protein n=1 Tax=marine sediment metagenome TaxID=412755 RepID=A0A0F9U258_9ZZZZ